jgi:pentatricopeptide repeat protein
MSRCASAARDRCLELERVIAGRARLGSLGLNDALELFEELLPHARPASVRAFNDLLNVFARAGCSSTSELTVSLFNRIAHACSNKVRPNLCTYSILIGCFCRMGRMEDGFAAFGLILKTGWRVDEVVIGQLLKGLCDAKRVDEAMDILL